MKKLMLLGGLRYLLPIIDIAHKLGIYVITVDYIPDNVAHKYSDEYHNISILDKKAVLKLAQQLEINGILSFAVDPGVITASYVAEKMCLPFAASYQSVKILQNKALFRDFLTKNGFNVPKAKGYKKISEALSDIEYFNWPVIVKPVDSAGSKGVTKVNDVKELETAIRTALKVSYCGCFIIEDYLDKVGFSSDSDCFTINGKLVYSSFSDQRFDLNAENPHTPSAYSWPSTIPDSAKKELHSELQRLITLLNLGTGIYNIETRLCSNGKPYIMEVSPRGGGNRLAEMLDIATNAGLVENAVRAAIGMDLLPMDMPIYNGYVAEIILHSDKEGYFDRLYIAPEIKPYIIQEDLWIHPGDKVSRFSGANNAIGTIVLRFSEYRVLDYFMNSISNWYKILLK